MLAGYSEPILYSFVAFPFVAALFTVPFLIYNYRKYGGIAILRVICVYSFILYSLCAFLLTVLPLPSREAVAMAPGKPILWKPLTDLMTGLRHAGLEDISDITDTRIWKGFLTSGDFFQIIANVIMMVPLGIYLRYYFRCSFKKTVLIGFLTSLFYELTQLSGLYFIYAHAYRYASVDDLFNNTLGSAIGYGIAPLFMLILPARDELDAISYKKGAQVTLMRRMAAAVLDIGLTGLFSVSGFLTLSGQDSEVSISLGIPTLVVFVLIPLLTKGSTPGQLLVKIRMVNKDTGAAPGFWSYLVRFITLYFIEPVILYLNIFAVFGAILWAMADNMESILTVFFFGACFLFVILSIWFVSRSIKKNRALPHTAWSRISFENRNKNAGSGSPRKADSDSRLKDENMV